MELWFIHFVLMAILIASSLYLWWKTRENRLLFISASFFMSSLVLACVFAGYFALFWFFLIPAVVLFIFGIPGISRAFRKLTREYAEESRMGPARFMIKLTKKYGPAKAVLLWAVIAESITFVVLFPVFTFLGYTFIECLLIFILGSIPVSVGIARFFYPWISDAVKREIESEKDSERETATTGDESGEVDT